MTNTVDNDGIPRIKSRPEKTALSNDYIPWRVCKIEYSFSKKEDLFNALIERYLESAMSKWEADFKENESRYDNSVTITNSQINSIMKYKFNNPHFLRFVFKAHTIMKDDPELDPMEKLNELIHNGFIPVAPVAFPQLPSKDGIIKSDGLGLYVKVDRDMIYKEITDHVKQCVQFIIKEHLTKLWGQQETCKFALKQILNDCFDYDEDEDIEEDGDNYL